ncbi:putative potassium voltage-gated channel subfamily H member 6-like [Scophthalmus maximus]|uniref:Putative potassium voltage-gated channel subfamily H member 6-like n=1 Tax=Scophthalmus maximus TaxID=52904 RepID=A0A2U9BKR1_SCOMX|nr:putative potassium voltage-gated channel subfamily H member 6-like [Scophthalmus maximus]
MGLLQRQIAVIPPSYSTLMSTANAPSSPILSPTVACPSGTLTPVFPTDESPATNPQRRQSNEDSQDQDQVLQQLPESNSINCGSPVLHLTASPPLIHASPHTASY